MIHEYAIDPEVAVCWGKNRPDFRFFTKSFGLGQPRIMSEFPSIKNWRKLFRRAAEGADDNEHLRITELFTILTERMVKRRSEIYDGNLSWLENALQEHKEYPFGAIIASSSRNSCSNLLPFTEIGFAGNAHWDVRTQVDCARNAREMANVVAALLSNCSEVHFIDPHFGPENIRHRRPLKAFLSVLNRKPYKTGPPTVQVHTSAKADANFFRSECERELPAFVPSGLTIILKRWKERAGGEKLHERFILTDIGGVKVGPGLDDGPVGESFQAMLLARDTYEKRWAEYVESPVFDLAEELVSILGRG